MNDYINFINTEIADNKKKYAQNRKPKLCRLQLFGNMMTSSNGIFPALLAICAGNSPVSGEFPTHSPMTRSFDVFF